MEFKQERKYYVYVWFYKETEEVFYVGKGTKYRYRSKKRDNPKLVEIINSSDCESKILKDGLTEYEAFECEKEIIEFLRKEGHPLINIQDGGHLPPSHLGVKRSDETKAKMSDSMKKYYETHPEIAKQQSEYMKEFLKTEKGKEFVRKSIESRDNDEFRKQQSIKCKAANTTKEYLERHSKITKEFWKSEKYVESHSGANHYRSQAIRQYDLSHNLIAEYQTIAEASRETGINAGKISLVASGKRKTAGGYVWEYVNEKKFVTKKRDYTYDVEKDKTAVPIMQYDLNGNLVAEYRSIAEAARINSFPNRTNIIKNLKGETKTAYKYVWKYKHGNTVPSP